MQVTQSLMIPKVVQNEIKTHFSKVCQCYEVILDQFFCLLNFTMHPYVFRLIFVKDKCVGVECW